MVQLEELPIDGDHAIDATERKAAEAARPRCSPLYGRRIAARVEGEDGPPSGQHAREQGQCDQPKWKRAANVQMQDVVSEIEQQPEQLERAPGIVHLLGRVVSVPREVDDRARYVLFEKEIPQRDEMRLDPSVWARVGTQQQHSHQSVASAELRAPSSSSVAPA